MIDTYIWWEMTLKLGRALLFESGTLGYVELSYFILIKGTMLSFIIIPLPNPGLCVSDD